MSADPRWLAQAEMLANRLAKNRRRLAPWSRREGVSCYRLYDRDIPEVPLAVDWYEGRLHVSVFPSRERPWEADPTWADLLATAARERLEVTPESVFLKLRQRGPGGTQYGRLDRRGAAFVVREGELRFRVNLSDYADTGLFLDHRTTRRMVAERAPGKHALNLFGYTGAFTVHAAAGGAASTTTVDLSHNYLEWALENLRLNDLDAPAHRLVQGDALGFLAEGAGEPYDLVILDPPTISRSKRMSGSFDVQRDHAELCRLALGRCRPGGEVFFSTNLRRFRPDLSGLDCREVQEITDETVPPDFGARRPHRCWRLIAD